MRACEPDREGFVTRDGVRVFYEVFGEAGGDEGGPPRPTIVFLTSWAIVHARQWKFQTAYLSRSFRVVTVDGRGNGRCDRPATAEAYADREYVDDAVAVMDAVGVERAVIAGVSLGGRHALQLAAWYPERAAGVVAVGTALPWGMPPWFENDIAAPQGWEKANRAYWLADYPGWVEFFMSQAFTEPHSTRQRETAVGWGLETTAETLLLTTGAIDAAPAEAEEVCRAVRCPVLVVHGDRDAIIPFETGEDVARWTDGELVRLRDAGHAPAIREPVKFNLLISDFVRSLGGTPASPPRSREWRRARSRPQRLLYLSSPIGLGHARRDVAIARELAAVRPDAEIDWLAQHPVTTVLEAEGMRVHPASRWLASESAHIASEAGEHDLHVFQAWRRMDEILVSNFMVLHDLVTSEHYDVVVGDEAWEADFFWHENPELKRSAFAWLTDFVGWLPMPSGGSDEGALTADYNAEMVEQIARYPRLRDRSIFVGNPDDLVDDPLGPGLPSVREWTEAHFDFPGYVTGLGPMPDREELRHELGYRPDEQVCVVAVGGSGVGEHLLRRAVAAHPFAAAAVDGLRMVVVTGPRLDPGSIDAPPGVEIHGYVPNLWRHLAACDLAVVQGGLTTTMELTAAGRPFLYFPLANHFEQQIHVPHRLSRYGAGRRLDYATSPPEVLGAEIAAEIARKVDYRPVETDGAARAAAAIAELL